MMKTMGDTELEHKRHTLAHLLAAAILELYPDAKRTIGPAIDDGFYFDFEFPSGPPSDKDFPKIERAMRKILPSWKNFERHELSADEAKKEYADNPYKIELIEEFTKDGQKVTFYKSGHYSDLCRGGHVENPSKDIAEGSWKLDRLAGAYWRGDEKNAMLTRIYGLAFDTKDELDAHVVMREEAAKRDHKKLGKELDLFAFSETIGKGLPLWTPKGSIIRRELERFIVDEEIKRGYLHVYTPDLARLALYEKSGHYPHYKDSMYAPIEIDKELFMLRPMTCPHHFELYLRKPVVYRELPMRIAELAQLYRYEQSGELMGLQRVRTFCLSDAHIICADEEQAVDEMAQTLDLIEFAAGKFGLEHGTDYHYRLSLGDRSDSASEPEKAPSKTKSSKTLSLPALGGISGDKYYKNDAGWEKAENLMRGLMEKRGKKFVEAKGEAAFYGPKIDIQMKNANGKEDTAFTVQYDFYMPERFDLTYIGEDGKKHRAFVVHRSSIGAIERIFAFLIERYAGAFPLWLSPVQVKVLPVSEKHVEYGRKVLAELKSAGLRAEIDDANESLGKKIRNAKTEKIPYLFVVGDKEIESNTVTVENRKESEGAKSLQEIIERMKKEFSERF